MQSTNPTSYGKFLKRLRVDTGDTLGEMAQKLGVSVSLLSSVESGAREIPSELSGKIRTAYRLNEIASDALLKAECETAHKTISVSLGEKSGDKEFVRAAISISRDLQELSTQEMTDLARQVHEKAQSKRKRDFSGWAALGVAAVIALGVGLAIAGATRKEENELEVKKDLPSNGN